MAGTPGFPASSRASIAQMLGMSGDDFAALERAALAPPEKIPLSALPVRDYLDRAVLPVLLPSVTLLMRPVASGQMRTVMVA